MIPKLLKIIVFFNLLLTSAVEAQEIWRESFPVSEKGIWGTGNGSIQSDFTGIKTWKLEYENVELFNEEDYAKTVATSGGRFEVRDVAGEIKWISEIIDITGYTHVKIELTAAETGSSENNQNKYLKAFFILNDGIEIPFNLNSVNAVNWGTNQVEQSGLSGDSLQIVVYFANNYSADKVVLDEVVVTGEENLEPLESGDLLINEILFNPVDGGTDYVEIFNHSENEIALNRLFLASRDKDWKLTQVYPLTNLKRNFLPGSYLCLTKDTAQVFPFYPIWCRECFLQMPKFPSFNNDEDDVVLLDENGQVIDELHYSAQLHSPFLATEKGISLERISCSKPTNNAGNWHSASSAFGYGTPGYKNSQVEIENLTAPKLTFNPEAFSPNSDGFNDEYKIQYELEKPGYVTNISIFDSSGRFILKLANNEILGTSGEITWNGTDETGQKQPLGVYVVLVEIFNENGEVHRFKDGVVLTGNLE